MNSLPHYYRTPTVYHPATETASKRMQEPCTKPDSKREMRGKPCRIGAGSLVDRIDGLAPYLPYLHERAPLERGFVAHISAARDGNDGDPSSAPFDPIDAEVTGFGGVQEAHGARRDRAGRGC
jgi:hypothetical protein